MAAKVLKQASHDYKCLNYQPREKYFCSTTVSRRWSITRYTKTAETTIKNIHIITIIDKTHPFDICPQGALKF